MTDQSFRDYVQVTMRGASNSADGTPLLASQIDELTDYLSAPGSGATANTSFKEFVSTSMSTHPPALPDGYEYVVFSGIDPSGTTNYKNARDYCDAAGGGDKAGIIGDTPLG